jgi:CheY-like chemotaxis protein
LLSLADHLLNLRLVTRLLQLQRFDVTAVADGGAALDALRSSYDSIDDDATADASPDDETASKASTSSVTVGGPFDLAILDMSMPLLSGPQVAVAFRAWETEHRPGAMRLPLVALTANAAEEHAAECAASGMDLFLSKPLRENALPALRAHAAAAAEARDVEAAARSATRESEVAAKAAAAAAAVARTVLVLGRGAPLMQP